MTTIREDGARQDTWVVRLVLGGQNFGIWDKKTGGDADSDSTVYYAGGMGPQQDLGGRSTTANIVLQRIFDRVDDLNKMQAMLNGVGRVRGTVSQRVMDIDENEIGKSLVWDVRLKRVLPPDVDGESSSAALLELEFTVRGKPTLV